MKTTLNLPDPVVLQAKRLALEEGTTLTAVIVQSLNARLEKTRRQLPLPASSASGGLCAGISWENLAVADSGEAAYR